MNWKTSGLALATLSVLAGACCGDNDPCFKIKTIMPVNGMFVAAPNVSFLASWQADLAGVHLGSTIVSGTTDGQGMAELQNVRVPAQWVILPNCAHSLPTIATVGGGSTVLVRCFTGSIFPFRVSPSAIAAVEPPDSLSLSVDDPGLSVTAGTSQVLFYDPYGTLVAVAPVSSVSADGTQFQVAPPTGLGSVPAGTYVLVVQSADSQSLGAGTLEVIGSAPPPDPEPDPCGEGGGLNSSSPCQLD